MKLQLKYHFFFLLMLLSCTGRKSYPPEKMIDDINLKKGELISCGPSEHQFGSVEFEVTCDEKEKKDFNLAVELLHSFEYEEAEKVFAGIIYKDPGCAMAYWGVAMSNYHPLWTPPSESELRKGSKAIEIAKSIIGKSKREEEYIEAVSAFYQDWNKVNHQLRACSFAKGMEKLYTDYPDDKEAAIFYALALDAAADPTDLSYKNQKKAGNILNALYRKEPNHPGIAHYIIHTYDYPELAPLALAVARRYASIAPSSAHAQHMPSHIFTRLGLWDESIASNLASIASARCYAETAGLKAHWDEEFHGMDYLIYAYLQKGEDSLAKEQYEYLKTINEVYPVNFKVAYAFATIPSRYLFENKLWHEAASLKIYPGWFPWKNFPWQEAIFHFTRLMGCVHTGKISIANAELAELKSIYDTLMVQKDFYKANEVQIQIFTSESWIHFEEGKHSNALKEMNVAADMEDKTEKHPVTPCEVIPARELLGDMELLMNNPKKALADYKIDLLKHPNRFNGLYSAGLSAEKSGNTAEASFYYRQLLADVDRTKCNRSVLKHIEKFLN